MKEKIVNKIISWKTKGISVADISRKLGCSETTIRFYLSSPKKQKQIRKAKLESYYKNK